MVGRTRKHSDRRKSKKSQTRRKAKEKLICHIPIQAPASSSSSLTPGNDFFNYVNTDWLKQTSIPPTKSIFGVSEEAEHCIDRASFSLLQRIQKEPKGAEEIMLQKLSNSCLHSRSQQNSVELLKEELKKLSCIETSEDVLRTLASFGAKRFPCLLGLSYTVDKDGLLQLLVNDAPPSLPLFFYTKRDKMAEYKKLLTKLGELLNIPGLEKIIGMEKKIIGIVEAFWSPLRFKTTGAKLQKKFPKIPWDIWFEAYGIDNWKQKNFYYSSPRFIRFVGKVLKEIPIDYWKLYLARILVLNSIEFLPPPFDELDFEFFRQTAQGQKEKQQQKDLLLKVVYSFCNDLFSPIFWKEFGSKEVDEMGYPFVQQLQTAAIRRLEATEWLETKTKKAAIKKLEKLQIEVVRPRHWAPFEHVDLDEKNLLQNIFTLGKQITSTMIKRIGHPYQFWEEGLYRVNAFYFTENNEIMIPFGTMISPYFIHSKEKTAWNLGSLGTIISHEICHAFDEDGRYYDERGQRKNWWTRGDSLGYGRKAKEFIQMYNKVKVLDSHVDGKKTLSENIADNGGMAISLQALKDTFGTCSEEEKKEKLREFFISYAVSWRTKIRDEKLKHALKTDRHAPADVRVNYVVNQFDEWYEAFDVKEEDALYVPKKDRVRLF